MRKIESYLISLILLINSSHAFSEELQPRFSTNKAKIVRLNFWDNTYAKIIKTNGLRVYEICAPDNTCSQIASIELDEAKKNVILAKTDERFLLPISGAALGAFLGTGTTFWVTYTSAVPVFAFVGGVIGFVLWFLADAILGQNLSRSEVKMIKQSLLADWVIDNSEAEINIAMKGSDYSKQINHSINLIKQLRK